jgi:Ser/Thr protein kinase RdoA (MazF antagonist)
MGTALLPQIKQPFFDDIVAAYLGGYRSERAFSREDEEALPAFLMICSLNYLGWFQKRGDNIEHADRIAGEVIKELLRYIPELMQQLTLVQRIAVNLLAWKY